MRIWWVATLVLLWTCTLLAQADGIVESIGLNGYYRADCWVPMAVQLRPTSSAAAELQIRVIQEDLDRDRVVATRDITLTPDMSGSAEPHRFWMYFRPQASDSGLADAAIGGSAKELANQLKVVVTTRGGATVATLPITQQSLQRAEVVPASGRPDDVQPERLVLCVTEGNSPAGREYANVVGLSATPIFLNIRPRDLPEDVRGFEMVDAIVWMGATAPDPRRSLEEPRYRAIEQYVHQGGLLVVCEGPESAKLRGFEQILPVKVNEYRESADLEPLLQMSGLKPHDESLASQPRRVAAASARPGSVVVRHKAMDGTNHPFIARGTLGSGCITWVAQDLAEPTLVRALSGGWVRIWDEVMGWRNNPTPVPSANSQTADVTAFGEPQGVVDIGSSFASGGSLPWTASGYVLIAVLFFAIYWAAAGPGMYAYLSLRKMAHLNWFMFGVVAVGAALLAAILVEIVQSGSPRLEHVTVVRGVPGGYSTVQSRIGLYIPSDGLKELQITGTADQTTNWITPYPEHPARRASGAQYLAMKQYTLPIVDATSDDPIAVSMPWRSTMKRLQVRWNGDLEAAISGKAALTGRGFPDIAGTLANATPWDLRDVYLAYRIPGAGDGSNAGGDRVIYIPRWDKGQTIDLAFLLGGENAFRIGPDRSNREAIPGYDAVVYGGIERLHRGFSTETVPGDAWAGFWYSRDVMNPNAFGLSLATGSTGVHAVTLPLASLFDRIPPMRNTRLESGMFRETRRTVARLGVRFMNASPAIAAGNLVVLAQARGSLPIPFTVDGDVPESDGMIICQYILPLGETSAPPAVEKQ